MKIVVTDGETRAALAAVRALGARGDEVHVVAARTPSLAGASRFAAREHPIADPVTDPKGWAEAIERLMVRLGAELLLPITEVSLGTLFHHGIERRLPVACPEPGAYEIAVDKHALLERAREFGIDCPRSFLVEDPSQLAALPEPLRYPVVLKARRSRFLVEGRWHGGSARIVRSAEELRADAEEAKGGLLLQEFIPGHGEGISLLASEGRTLVRFAHRRIREKPPTGGVSVQRESIAPDPALLAGCERLLQSLRWTGVAMLEFRRAPDGRAALLEMNPRLWGSLQLAVDAGVDFPSLLVDLHRGLPVAPHEPRLGVRTRWLLGDLDSLLITLRRRRVRELTGVSASHAIGDFLRSFVDGSRSEVLRRDDPRPFLRELRQWLGELRH